jgi:hypothetical protein
MFDFEPSPVQDQVRAVAREFAATVLAPRVAQLEQSGAFPRDALARAAARGLLAVNVPKELGGLQAGAVAYALAMMETGRACASTTVAMCVSNMVTEVLHAFGNADQRSEHVPKLCSGEYVVGGFALSEAGAGSDPGGMQTRARKTQGGWLISGSKLWITSGTDAGLFVVWARTHEGAGSRGISAFLVRGDTPGLRRGRPEHKLGLRGSTTTALDFDDCEVSEDALLGEAGHGFRVAMMALDGGRIGIASQAVGIGTAALEEALAWARASAAQAGVQAQLADAATELEAARLLVLRAALRKERGLQFSREAAMAKLFASERGFAACQRAMRVLGPAGIDRAGPIQRYLRDMRVTMIYEGTSEIQRVVLGREIDRRFATG